jgi:hypothetical protein
MVDERSLEALRRLRQADESARITLAEFKMLVREQFFMLLLDRDAALAAIPKLLPDNMDERRKAFSVIQDVLSASAQISGEVADRATLESSSPRGPPRRLLHCRLRRYLRARNRYNLRSLLSRRLDQTRESLR